MQSFICQGRRRSNVTHNPYIHSQLLSQLQFCCRHDAATSDYAYTCVHQCHVLYQRFRHLHPSLILNYACTTNNQIKTKCEIKIDFEFCKKKKLFSLFCVFPFNSIYRVSQQVLDGLIGYDNPIGLWWVWVAYPKTTIPYQDGCLPQPSGTKPFLKNPIICYSPNYYSQLVLDGLIGHDNQIGLWWVWVAYPKTTIPYQDGCLNNHREPINDNCYSPKNLFGHCIYQRQLINQVQFHFFFFFGIVASWKK